MNLSEEGTIVINLLRHFIQKKVSEANHPFHIIKIFVIVIILFKAQNEFHDYVYANSRLQTF